MSTQSCSVPGAGWGSSEAHSILDICVSPTEAQQRRNLRFFLVEKQKCDTCKDWTLLIGLVQKCRCVCVQLCSLTPLRISSHHGLGLQFLSPGLLHHLFKDVSGFTLFPPVHTFHQGQLDLLKTSMKSCHPFA